MLLQVWDVKFPIAIVPHSWMSNKRVSILACVEFDFRFSFVPSFNMEWPHSLLVYLVGLF